MKLRYIKENKISYGSGQLRKGDIIDKESFGNLPPEWFEVISERKVEKVIKKPKKIKEEVDSNGIDEKSTNEDLGS